MFIRLKKTNTTPVLELLESYRDAEGTPRHRRVVSLGDANIPKEIYPLISRQIESHYYNLSTDLFDAVETTEEVRNWIDFIIRKIETEGRWKPSNSDQTVSKSTVIKEVETETVEHENTTMLGPVLVANHSWNSLGLDTILAECGMCQSHITASKISVINRLINPGSENSLIQWVRTTALGDLTNENFEGWARDRFYRASDALLKNQEKIESHLRKETSRIHSPDRTILLYDLTNSHFEGECLANENAKYGQNKQKRNDCPQVVVGVIFDASGFELGHKMFAGNQSDSKSLPEMAATMKSITAENDPQCRTLVVTDSGMSGKDNIVELYKNGYNYLMNDRRPSRTNYTNEFLNRESFVKIPGRDGKPGVYVKHLIEKRVLEDGEDTIEIDEQVLLCFSEEREKKETAMISNAEARYLDSLEQLKKRIDNGRLKKTDKILSAIGKLESKNSRVRRFYEVNYNAETSELTWKTKDKNSSEDAKKLCGGYVLRTSDMTLDKERIWETYIALTTAESGFRTLKGTLGLRPNFHQAGDRVDGHVFITILAYQLLRNIMYTLEKNGDTRSWETIRSILKTHAYTTIILPEVSGKVHRIRKAGKPDETQKDIYAQLGINWLNLPKRHVVITSK